MFSGDWVQENLSLAQSDKRPKLDRCNQIAAEFKRAFALANPIWDSPHIYWARGTAAPTATKRWPEYVVPMAEVTQAMLTAANEGRVPPFGYSKDGPVVRLLVKALSLITGEQITAAAVSQDLYRQLRRRSK
jgi:hypothetical protein